MKKLFRTLQFLSNIAIIIIAVMAGVVFARHYLFTPDAVVKPTVAEPVGNVETAPVPVNAQPSGPTGRSVPLENIDWKENEQTLVLYLSTACRYCKESTPFYQKLIKKRSGKHVKLVAVFSQPENESKRYLKAEGLNISQVYQASFRSIGVSGTPTLLLVNDNGMISGTWRGKLTPDKENELLSRLDSALAK